MSMINIGGALVGGEYPCFVIAELGQNHQGDLDVARRLIRAAAYAGCDAVKLQKRTLEICIPDEQRDVLRETPWGVLRYFDYRRRLEFDDPDQWALLIDECRTQRIAWFASCWDEPACDFIEPLRPVAHKVASACVTDAALLERMVAAELPIIVSTGACTKGDVGRAVRVLEGRAPLALLHCNSAYPTEPRDVNLRAMRTLMDAYGAQMPIGYSGHERGIQISVAAVAMGAKLVERHLTLDRTMWGTDHAASLEPEGMRKLVRDIRVVEQAMGDGVKRVTDAERAVMKRLRRVAG